MQRKKKEYDQLEKFLKHSEKTSSVQSHTDHQLRIERYDAWRISDVKVDSWVCYEICADHSWKRRGKILSDTYMKDAEWKQGWRDPFSS